MQKPAERSRMPLQDSVKLIVNGNLRIYTYKISRKIALKYGLDLYSIYKEVAKFREESYPKNLVVTETKCVVRLQQLLNYTIEPLFMCLNLSLYDKENTTLLLILKYGFDGMDVNAYRQKSDDQKNSFSSIFCCSMVPLRLIDKTTKTVHWENPRPSLVKLCRPITISYEKETDELCKNQERDIMAQRIVGCFYS
ncbi:hypothetical protein TSAR_013745 [Trichomalopsis sarcophagae]|uniref:Uncharacterized protein n=1 Tax=Trichomalopsis sarcophagae TaxID=543379 RepID=A0A232FNN1_9HYME|nr:hypothetical protein TSAR_013745 [Trichomalopsis sarcophagae]